jgi:hypothetical protein
VISIEGIVAHTIFNPLAMGSTVTQTIKSPTIHSTFQAVRASALSYQARTTNLSSRTADQPTKEKRLIRQE